MKVITKLFFFSLLVLASGALKAQEHENEIRSNINVYFQATEEKDWEGVMDMIYPKLFDLVSREQMIQMFQQMEAEGMEFNMGEMEIKKISPVKSFEKEQFALVDYSANMELKFTGESFSSPEVIDMMKTNFQNSYGPENVAHNKVENSFDIYLEKSMFAIASEGSNGWKFVEYNKDQEFLMDQLVPKEVRKEFDEDQ